MGIHGLSVSLSEDRTIVFAYICGNMDIYFGDSFLRKGGKDRKSVV